MEKEEIVGAMCSGARRVFSMLILGAVVRGRPSTFEPSTCQQHQFAGRQKPNKKLPASQNNNQNGQTNQSPTILSTSHTQKYLNRPADARDFVVLQSSR